MYQPVEVAIDHGRLRQRAVAQLSADSLPNPKRASPYDALAVLHQLALSPSTAGDALALLHELQVHQVEVDLQLEELREVRSELEAALTRQTSLVERGPIGYLTIDARTVVCTTNLAGARLLGAARDDLLGRPLAGLLSAAGAGALQALLARARDGLESETCELQLLPQAGIVRRVNAAVDRDTAAERYLLVLMAATPPNEGDKAARTAP